MKLLNRTGRIFYGTAIAATGIQQFFFPEFFHLLFPPLPFRIAGLLFVSRLVAAVLVIAGTAIVLNKKTRNCAYLLGFLFFFLFIFCQVPYELFISPYSPIHLGVWINALKEFAYAGGALAIAGQMPVSANTANRIPGLIALGRKISPFGPIMFSITMICFGVAHFYYTDTVKNLVPVWIPLPLFWTYFAGFALIGSGIAIIIHFRESLIGNLLGLMIFLWFILLHIPRAIASPLSDNGNEVTSAFSALAFSGIALVIANGRESAEKGRS